MYRREIRLPSVMRGLELSPISRYIIGRDDKSDDYIIRRISAERLADIRTSNIIRAFGKITSAHLMSARRKFRRSNYLLINLSVFLHTRAKLSIYAREKRNFLIKRNYRSSTLRYIMTLKLIYTRALPNKA